MMLLASFNLIIYENISFERTREISIISNIKYLNYDVSDHGMLWIVAGESFFNVLTIVKL